MPFLISFFFLSPCMGGRGAVVGWLISDRKITGLIPARVWKYPEPQNTGGRLAPMFCSWAATSVWMGLWL